ncbi:MAG TPA: S41 family peptidase [Acidobacteriota bacterium]|jgi:carboxyl-terminal processing protease
MHSKGRLLILFVSVFFVAYAVVGGMLGRVEDARVKTYKELRLFSDVLAKIQSDYVDIPDLGKTLAGALQGMLDALDPYCSYVPANAVVEMKNRNEKFKGEVGVFMAKRYGYGYVVTVLDGGPADAAGLRTGDIIESVSGKLTTALSLAEIESQLRGPEGTPVELMVIHPRSAEAVKISPQRKLFSAASVQAKVVEPEIGYLKIPTFSPGIFDQAAAKLRMLSSGKLSGLVLDLRGTTMGNYEEALKVADLFLPSGKMMASLNDRKQKIKDYISTDSSSDTSVPVAILTSTGTSGPAEVLIAALKDNKRVRVIGERTSGTASLQKSVELEDGALLIVTTELFHSPAGDPIQNKNMKKSGVQPDEKVPDDAFLTNFYYQNPSLSSEEQYQHLIVEVEKLQLQKAIDSLKGSIKKAA